MGNESFRFWGANFYEDYYSNYNKVICVCLIYCILGDQKDILGIVCSGLLVCMFNVLLKVDLWWILCMGPSMDNSATSIQTSVSCVAHSRFAIYIRRKYIKEWTSRLLGNLEKVKIIIYFGYHIGGLKFWMWKNHCLELSLGLDWLSWEWK